MRSLKDRLKNPDTSSRPTRAVYGTQKEQSAHDMAKEMARDFMQQVQFTGASFPGPPGPGVATGGSINQVLAKKSAADYDTQWVDSAGTAITIQGLVADDVNFASANKAVIQSYIDAAVTGGASVLNLPWGTYYVVGNMIPKWTPHGLVIQGQGMGQTVLQLTRPGGSAAMFRRLSVDDANYSSGGRVCMRDMTLSGTWQTYQVIDPAGQERLTNLSGFDSVIYERIQGLDSSSFGLTAESCYEVSFLFCEMRRICKDALTFTGSYRSLVVGNRIFDCWDDCISGHTKNNPATFLPGQNHICAFNYAENANGIKYLGLTRGQITDNQLVRCQGYGIFVRQETSAQQGYNDSNDVIIARNIINDVISKQLFGNTAGFMDGIHYGSATASSVNAVNPAAIIIPSRIWPRSNNVLSKTCSTVSGSATITNIATSSLSLIYGEPVTGAGLVPGSFVSTWTASTVVLNLNATSGSNTTHSFGGNFGGNRVKICDNVISQTLWNTSSYSDWGVNSAPTGNPAVPNDGIGAWTQSGYQNQVTPGNLLGATSWIIEIVGGSRGITLTQQCNDVEVSGNKIEGFDNAIGNSTAFGGAGIILYYNNVCRRYKTAGINLDNGGAGLTGTFITEYNLFDADPYFEHVNRSTVASTTNGLWNLGDSTPVGVNGHSVTGTWVGIGNIFRNLNVTYYPTTAPPTIQANNIYYKDNTGRGINRAFSPDQTDRTVVEYSDPTQSNYGLAATDQVAVSFGQNGPGHVQSRWYSAPDARGVFTQAALSSNQIVAIPFYVQGVTALNQMGIQVAVASATAQAAFAVYKPNGGLPSALFKDFGTANMSTVGLASTTPLSTSVVFKEGWYFLCINATNSANVSVNAHAVDGATRQTSLGYTSATLSSGRGLETTFTWNPGTLTTSNCFVQTTVTLPGATFGDIPNGLGAPYDIQGIEVYARVSAADTLTVTGYFNPGITSVTNSVVLGASTWVAGVTKRQVGDFVLTYSNTFGSWPAALNAGTFVRVATTQEPRIVIRNN